MTEVRDTLQVGLANTSAIAFSITDCNEILTLVSLTLAISFTIYKFIQFEKNKVNQIKVLYDEYVKMRAQFLEMYNELYIELDTFSKSIEVKQ